MALHGDYRVPPGDVGVVAIVSVKRQEANERLRTIRAILDALEVSHEPEPEGGVALSGRPVVFRVHTATMAGVSGFTAICCLCDEVSKWRDADTGANPATEVLASLRPTMATIPSSRIVLSSSPVGNFDAHARAFDAGPTELQHVAHATSWEANPTLTEAETRKLEPDEWRWAREYAAIPAEDSESGLLSASLLDQITVNGLTVVNRSESHTYLAVMDPATRGNAWTLTIWTYTSTKVKAMVRAREWRGTPTAPLDPDRVLGEIAQECFEYRLNVVHTDNWSGDALSSIARRHGLRLMPRSLSAGEKLDLYEDLADRIADGSVALLDIPQVRADLLSIRRRITPNGVGIVLMSTPDGRHSDYAPTVAMGVGTIISAPPPNLRTDAKAIDRDILKRELARYAPKKSKRYWERVPWQPQ